MLELRSAVENSSSFSRLTQEEHHIGHVSLERSVLFGQVHSQAIIAAYERLGDPSTQLTSLCKRIAASHTALVPGAASSAMQICRNVRLYAFEVTSWVLGTEKLCHPSAPQRLHARTTFSLPHLAHSDVQASLNLSAIV